MIAADRLQAYNDNAGAATPEAGTVDARIARLASDVRSAWHKRAYAERAFADIAHDSLCAFVAQGPLRSRDLAAWLFSAKQLGAKARAAEGHPAVELYRDDRFCIEAAFWFQHLTDICEDDVTGAVALVEGLAVVGEYELVDSKTVAPGVARGHLALKRTSLLRAGDVRRRGGNAGDIEQTMYLDTTCVTLVVRTNDAQPRFEYREPGLRFLVREPTGVRSRQYTLLAEMPTKFVDFAVETHVLELLRRGTLLDAIELLSFMTANNFEPPLLEDLCRRADAAHGGQLIYVWRAIERYTDQRVMASIRSGTKTLPRHRLLFFMLVFLPDRAAMLAFLSREYPDDNAEQLLWAWLMEVKHVLGFDVHELSTLLLKGLFEGLNKAQLFERLRDEYEPEDVEAQRGAIEQICHNILELPIFRGLLSASPWPRASHPPAYECSVPEVLQHVPHAGRARPIPPRFADTLMLNPEHWVQSGDTLPEPLRELLPFADRLSRRKPILWVREPATGHFMPYWFSQEHTGLLEALQKPHLDRTDVSDDQLYQLYQAGILVCADGADGKVAAWDRLLQTARASYARNGYALLPGLVSPLHIAALRSYYRALHEAGGFSPERVSQKSVAIHLEPATRFLQHQILRTVNQIVPEPVQASFCYTRIYEPGSELPRHVDRPGCAWNISLPYDLSPETERADSWPLYLGCPDGEVEIRLAMGDGVLYRGVTTEHWRHPQPDNHRSTMGLLMYAPADFEGTLY